MLSNNRRVGGKTQEQNTSYSWFSVGSCIRYLSTVASHPGYRKLLGKAIRQYRKKAKMTQEDLGEAADLNPKYIGEVERAEKTISVDALMRISSAVKTPIAHFFRGL
jgi:DNA-binding XRE family transcriptional regulator